MQTGGRKILLLLSFDFMSSWGCLNYRLTFTGPSPSPASPQCLNSQLSCAGVSDKDHFSRCVRRREVCFTGTKRFSFHVPYGICHFFPQQSWVSLHTLGHDLGSLIGLPCATMTAPWGVEEWGLQRESCLPPAQIFSLWFFLFAYCFFHGNTFFKAKLLMLYNSISLTKQRPNCEYIG